MECVDSVKSQEFLMSGPDSLHYHLLSEAVYGFGQHLLLRFDPHRVGFLYIECHSNPLPRGIWQRLPLSTERSLLNRSGKKKAPFHPQFRAHVEGKLFQCCRLSTSLNTGVRGASLKTCLTVCV